MCNITSVRVHTLEVTDTDEEREADGIITVEKKCGTSLQKEGLLKRQDFVHCKETEINSYRIRN